MEELMNKFRRFLSAVLAVVMIAGAVTVVGAANVTFTDVSGHWAWTGGQIPYLVDKGVLNGYQQPNGTYLFKPNGEITRAEFIKILDETFGLTATASIDFKDVTTGDWYYPYFAKAAAQGYILNYGSYANPNGKITREEALALLVRYLDLPANEKSSTSYFADYNTISDNFKDYVLRGVYAGLTDGYNENGVKNFKPQKTLTRAEALTILYRAAGCIFNTNAYSRDNSAPDDNNVVTKGDVTLRGIYLTGRNIISEGATSGTVTYSDCQLNGTLYIRGSANVIFDDCEISEVVVLGGGDVSLLNDTEVDEMTVGTKTSVKVFSGTSVENLTVLNGADYTAVTGDGALGTVTINARGFSSSMTPSEFEIGNNLTATFSNTEYSGSSATQNSFTLTPFVTADEDSAYINLISDAEGELYYYYSNSDNAPSIANFDSYYEASSYAGHFEVEAGEGITEETFDLETVEKFDYVILQLQDGSRKYAPVAIPNSVLTGTGFSTEPYLSDDTKVKFQAKQGGVVFCYYTNSGTGITQLEFLDEYANTESALRKEASVNSLKSYSIELNKNYLENYEFVAFMLKTANGQYYAPVILPMGENGFSTEPSVTEPGKISFKTSVTGELYYYYSETAAIPGAADFYSAYRQAEERDSEDVKKNVTASLSYDTRLIAEYPYIIMAIEKDDEFFQPVAVYVNYSNGFDTEPEVRSGDTVRFKTEVYGTVYYYYTKSDAAPTSEEFMEEYNSTKSRLKDDVDCGRSAETIELDHTTALSYPYMVFMLVDDDDKEYVPYVLELDADSATGFTTTPTVTKIGRDYHLTFKTKADGEVWYFFSPDDAYTSASEFYDYWNDNDADGVAIKNVNAKTFETVDLDRSSSELRNFPYVIVAFYNPEEDEFSTPIILNITETAQEDSGSGLNGITVGSKYVTVETLFDGRLYWYNTNDDEAPDADDAYDAYYAASGEKSTVTLDAGDEVTDITIDEDYDYIVLVLRITNDDGDYEWMEPVLVDIENKTTDGDDDSSSDGHTTNSYGFSVVNVNPTDRIITIEAEESGTIYISYTVDGEPIALIGGSSSKNVIEGREYEIKYTTPALGILLNGDVKVVLQLKNDDDTFKARSIPVIEE